MDTNIRGVSYSSMLASPNGQYVSNNKYCFGKATTQGFQPIMQIEPKEFVYNIALTQAVSPYTYKEGYRKKANILGVGNVIILDIDADQPDPRIIESLKALPIEFYTIPSQNHLIGNSVRYRVFIPYTGLTITPDQYGALVNRLVEDYRIPYVDSASKGYARFYAPTMPITGMPFAKFSEEQAVPYTATAGDIEVNFLNRLGISINGDNLVVNPDFYPLNDDTSKRLVVTESMLQAKTEEFQTATEKPIIVGDTLTEVYKVRTDDKNVSSDTMEFLLDKGKMAIGDTAQYLSRNTRVNVLCPTAHLHTDPSDKAYAWLLKDGGVGHTRLFCESNHCQEKFGSGGRLVTLPDYKEFILDRHIDTITAVDNMYDFIEDVILFHLGGEKHILNYTGVSFDNRYDAQSYVRDVFANDLIDVNAVKVMILHTFVNSRSGHSVYNISPAGTIIGDIRLPTKTQSSLDIVKAWGKYIFKHKWSDFRDFVRDKQFTQGATLKTMLHHIKQDSLLTTEAKKLTKMDASIRIERRRRIRLSVADDGLVCESIDNSFDTLLLAEYRRLKPTIENIGGKAYEEIKTAFIKHWELPLGNVEWDNNTVDTLPQLIMYLSLLNMYSGAQASMQRHTTIGVVAPPSMGKTALCNQFHGLGLTNNPNDMQVADIAPDGLSAIGLAKFTNRLFITADEIDAKKFKHQISEDKFRANLTSAQLTLNVKGRVDSVITTYAKVLWGAQLKQAFDNLDAPYEMLNRMFIVDYSSLYNERRYIHNILETHSVEEVDAVIRHYIITLFLGVRKEILSLDKGVVYRFFSRFIEALKQKYLGSLEVDTTVNEDGEVEVVSVRTRVTDIDRQKTIIAKTLLKWGDIASSHPVTTQSTPLVDRTTVDSPNFRYMLQRDTAMVLNKFSLSYMGNTLSIDDVIKEGVTVHDKLIALCEFLMIIHPTRIYVPLSPHNPVIHRVFVDTVKKLSYLYMVGKLGMLSAAELKRLLTKIGFKVNTLSKIPDPTVMLDTHGSVGKHEIPKLKPDNKVIQLLWIEKDDMRRFIDEE